MTIYTQLKRLKIPTKPDNFFALSNHLFSFLNKLMANIYIGK